MVLVLVSYLVEKSSCRVFFTLIVSGVFPSRAFPGDTTCANPESFVEGPNQQRFFYLFIL